MQINVKTVVCLELKGCLDAGGENCVCEALDVMAAFIFDRISLIFDMTVSYSCVS